MSKILNTKLTSLEKKWVLYDVGNSAFILLVSTIFPIYFNFLTQDAGISPENSLAYWGYAVSLVTIIVAILGPILGSYADLYDMKRKFLAFAVIIGSISCALTGFISSWLNFIILFIISKSACNISLIFNDAMLLDITTKNRMDNVSSKGFAYGYIGSCIPFVLGLIFVLFDENSGISIAFIINALWWFVMSIPIIKSYKQLHFKTKIPSIKENISGLLATIKEISNNKQQTFFLISFFLYIDGVYTIIDMATAYGTALGLDDNSLLLALLLTQIIAFPCTIFTGRLSNTHKTSSLLSICIIGYIFIAIFAIFLRTQLHFWILAILVGMFQGSIQALSRSYFGKIIPVEKSGEYYGIMDICGKGASFLGTILVSFVTQITGELHLGISVITPIMIIGYVLFRKSLK